jgi:hypothetical protein
MTGTKDGKQRSFVLTHTPGESEIKGRDQSGEWLSLIETVRNGAP